MMEIVRLVPEQYQILAQVEEGFIPDRENSIALLAVEDGKRIVGRMFLVAAAHIEGTWLAEDVRRGRTGFLLERRMEEEARKEGLKKLFAYTPPELGHYMGRLGYKKLALEIWEKEI